MKYAARFLLGFVLSCAFVSPGCAEEAGVLSGVVDDPGGAPMGGVSVTLRDPKGDAVSATSDHAGHFRFAGLAAGEYVLVAKADGFKEAIIPLQIGTAPLPAQRVRMKIAAVNQELTVAATVDPIAADSNNDGLQIDKDLLKSLPVKEGSPLATVSLFLDPAAAGVEGPKVIVDGVETSSLDVPESGIKKVFVNKNPYSAEFGRPGKGRIEVTTRPGSTSRIRKRLLFTLRDSSLDARNAFARTKPIMQRDLLESEVDGRLPGNKGTFYLGGDYLKDNQNSIVSAVTPSGAVSENVLSPQRDWHVLGRIDWHLTALHTLSLRYNRARDARRNQGIGAFDLRDRGYDSVDTVQEIRLGESAILSPTLFNEIRFAVKDRGRDAHSLTDAPAILVPGAFHAGGAQISQERSERDIDFQDVGNLIRGNHTVRMGGGVKRRSIAALDASNFGGTFTFASLAGYLENQPLLLTINQGNPAVSFSQTEVFSFVQDEMRLRPNVGLLVGLRHSFQSNVAEHAAFAPRMALSYAPGAGRTVFRAGAGIFYDRQPWAMEQQAMMFDGSHIRQTVISNPRPDLPPSAVDLRPLSLVRIAGDIRMPYITRGSAAVEQKIGKSSSVSAEYAVMRGLRLYRLHNINAPLPGSGVRPRADVLNLNQFESSGMSHNRSLTITFRTGYRSRFEMLSQYTLSRTLDNTSGMFSLPANNYDLHDEFGRADFDRRHRLNTAAIVHMPMGWKLGLISSVSSGLPYNITTGFDNNGDTVVNDRPAGLGRNTGRGPGLANADVRLSRRYYTKPEKETKSPYVEVRFDAFNVFNHLNATNYVGTLTSPLYGRANSALAPRQLQVSAKLSF